MEVSVLASLFDEMSSEHAQQSVVSSMVSTEDLYWVERLCCEAEENEDDDVDEAELEELGFVFSENNTNTTTMFADVAGNDSVVNFDDDAQINIDDI